MKKIIVDPKIMLGKPTIEGTRITVEQVLKMLAQELKIKDILDDFPQLTEEDVKNAVSYAAKAVANIKTSSINYS